MCASRFERADRPGPAASGRRNGDGGDLVEAQHHRIGEKRLHPIDSSSDWPRIGEDVTSGNQPYHSTGADMKRLLALVGALFTIEAGVTAPGTCGGPTCSATVQQLAPFVPMNGSTPPRSGRAAREASADLVDSTNELTAGQYDLWVVATDGSRRDSLVRGRLLLRLMHTGLKSPSGVYQYVAAGSAKVDWAVLGDISIERIQGDSDRQRVTAVYEPASRKLELDFGGGDPTKVVTTDAGLRFRVLRADSSRICGAWRDAGIQRQGAAAIGGFFCALRIPLQ